MTIIKNDPVGIMDSVTGETTNAWADALDWPCWGFDDKTLIIKNTDVGNDLNYRVLVRTEVDGMDHEEVTDRTLVHGDTARIALNNSYARIKVQVIDTAAGSHADYQIDYIGTP